MSAQAPLDSLLLNQRYQLETRIGSGGMSTVYRARDLTLERVVAVKVLREQFSCDEAFRQRFHQEAKAAANLTHPNIITVHDFGLDQERLFIVMEYVPGTDLKALLQRRGRFTVAEALPLMIQACAGLGYAHRAGLVHCDVKPHNLIVTPEQRVKVTDFGIARALVSIEPDEKSTVVWGSPQYFSSEQAAGHPPSPASDVYSLGVVFYEMLTGRLPFAAESSSELARLHREAIPAPPRQYNPAIPPALEAVILKVLEKEPTARYRTADQLGQVLITINQAPPGDVKPPAGAHAPVEEAGRSSDVAPTLPPLRRPGEPSPSFHKLQTERPQQPEPVFHPRPAPGIDWITWLLFFTALIAMGGLIPLWLWVYFAYTR
ncbi:MAG: protein kinase domain-containing protein [Chloroflexota bacterium]